MAFTRKPKNEVTLYMLGPGIPALEDVRKLSVLLTGREPTPEEEATARAI